MVERARTDDEADDPLVQVGPVHERYGDFVAFLDGPRDDEAAWRLLRMSKTSGRPFGGEAWLDEFEARRWRTLKLHNRRPRGKGASGDTNAINYQ